jgi:hypothetical protein
VSTADGLSGSVMAIAIAGVWLRMAIRKDIRNALKSVTSAKMEIIDAVEAEKKN